jgi:hypothetical protein
MRFARRTEGLGRTSPSKPTCRARASSRHREVLYRATLTNNASLWGTGNAVVWQPLADGIAKLAFRYFDAAGVEIEAPGGTETTRDARRRIASIEIRLVALERRADAAWIDTADPNPATARHRKAAGVETVVLRSAVGTTRADRARPPA